VDHKTNLAQITEQADALRAAAVAAGPDAKVPTCPKWTVRDLVSHIGGVHSWVRAALRVPAGDEGPAFPQPPEDWPALLDWWDENRAALLVALDDDPERQAWAFVPGLGSVGWWARRQAHETAIHRLDAEHALDNSVPTLVFDTEFAADGIDEVVAMMSPFRAKAKRPPVTVEGTLLVHAADAGRAWVVHAEGGELEVKPVEGAAMDVDATLAGTADSVYRAAWKRPSTAIATGRLELLDAIHGG
jgi:uncharacterized protein (TIGR03083 family)